MPVLPFERARRNAVKHLETYLVKRTDAGRFKPIREKSALFRAMQKWESFFPGRSLPVHELFLWLDLVDQSVAGNRNTGSTGQSLLDLMKAPYTDPTLPAKDGDPWCHIDLRVKTVTIAGETYHIDHKPTLLVLSELAKGSEDNPVPPRKLRHIPSCGHASHVGRLLRTKLPAEIKQLLGRSFGPRGGRWLVPPWQV